MSKDGPGRLAIGEGGVPKLAGKSAFTPEAGLADLSTVDDPRPQKPEPDAPAGERLDDPIDPSDLARSDAVDGGGSAAPSSAALPQGMRDGDAVDARPASSGSPSATAPVPSPADTPGGVAQSGAGSQPVGSAEIVGGSPAEPLTVLQAQVQVLTEQIQELRTALSEAAIGGAGPASQARDGEQPVESSSAPLAAEVPAARLQDTTGSGADAPAQSANNLSGLLQGVEPPIETAAAAPATALGSVTDVISAAADAVGAGLPSSVIGQSTAGAADLLPKTADVGAPSDLVQDGAEVLGGVVTAIVDAPGAPALETATDVVADAVDPIATEAVLPAAEPATDLLAEVAETAVEVPAPALDLADDIVEQPASAIEGVTPPALTEALDVAAPAPPPPALEDAPEPPAPTMETLLANVVGGIVVPGSVSDPEPPPPAEPKPSPAEDDGEGDPMAGTGLADDPADAGSPTDWLGGLGGPLGGPPGAAPPPPPDPFDAFGL